MKASTDLKSLGSFTSPNTLFLLILGLFFLACSPEVPTEEVETIPSRYQFFERADPLPLTIKSDFTALFNRSGGEEDDNQYQKAYIEYQSEDGTTLTEEIRIRKRGVTRRKICDFPPLKLKFPIKGKDYTLKLVTHCKKEDDLQDLVLREYLVYKIYNLITDYSFKVRLLNIKYEDTAGQYPAKDHYAFLIEDETQLANRLDAAVLETPMKLQFIDLEQSKIFSLFQYLIGNTDWNLTRRHNLKIITPHASDRQPLGVPYDFDYSGLVNAPYAVPHPDLPNKSIRDRHFMWRGKDRKGFATAIKLMEDKKGEMLQLIRDFSYLGESDRQDMITFLEKSFELLPQQVEP